MAATGIFPALHPGCPRASIPANPDVPLPELCRYRRRPPAQQRLRRDAERIGTGVVSVLRGCGGGNHRIGPRAKTHPPRPAGSRPHGRTPTACMAAAMMTAPSFCRALRSTWRCPAISPPHGCGAFNPPKRVRATPGAGSPHGCIRVFPVTTSVTGTTRRTAGPLRMPIHEGAAPIPCRPRCTAPLHADNRTADCPRKSATSGTVFMSWPQRIRGMSADLALTQDTTISVELCHFSERASQ